MDPNAARARMIEKANLVLAHVTPMGEAPYDGAFAAVELAEAVHDLDEWLRAGGFFPTVWTKDVLELENQRRKQDVDIHVPDPVPSMVDDEKPPTDTHRRCGTQFQEGPGGYLLPCGLDRGHDGPHA